MGKTIIERMCSIAEKLKADDERGKMSLANKKKAASDINALAKTLGLSKVQVVILTAIMKKSFVENLDRGVLASNLGLSYLQFLSYHNDMLELRKKGYIRLKTKGIILSKTAMDCLINNRPVLPEPMTGLDARELLVRIKKVLDQWEDEQCSMEEMAEEVYDLLELNPDNSVARSISTIMKELPVTEKAMLYILVYLYYFEEDDMVASRVLCRRLTFLPNRSATLKKERLPRFFEGVSLLRVLYLNSSESSGPGIGLCGIEDFKAEISFLRLCNSLLSIEISISFDRDESSYWTGKPRIEVKVCSCNLERFSFSSRLM